MKRSSAYSNASSSSAVSRYVTCVSRPWFTQVHDVNLGDGHRVPPSKHLVIADVAFSSCVFLIQIRASKNNNNKTPSESISSGNIPAGARMYPAVL